MIKVEAMEEFILGKFDEIKDTIARKSREETGKLFVGDIFECDKDMADYLLGANAFKRAFVKVIEIMPDKLEEIKEEKPKKTIAKKETKSKKTIAKK